MTDFATDIMKDIYPTHGMKITSLEEEVFKKITRKYYRHSGAIQPPQNIVCGEGIYLLLQEAYRQWDINWLLPATAQPHTNTPAGHCDDILPAPGSRRYFQAPGIESGEHFRRLILLNQDQPSNTMLWYHQFRPWPILRVTINVTPPEELPSL
jgi:hypothetical protein